MEKMNFSNLEENIKAIVSKYKQKYYITKIENNSSRSSNKVHKYNGYKRKIFWIWFNNVIYFI